MELEGLAAEWRDPRSTHGERICREERSGKFFFTAFCSGSPTALLRRRSRRQCEPGMRVGLIADLAVGMSGDGSHAWTSQDDSSVGLEIGAPPDLFNANGQNWGLTTFSPRALAAGGFAPFIATLRACMRHAGGLRIDHAMGLMRLWVIPRGAQPARAPISPIRSTICCD